MNNDSGAAGIAATSERAASRAFESDVDPRGMYFSPTLQQRVDLIEHLIEFGRQIIVLSGPVDSGKTTLLNHFATAQRSSWYTVFAHGGPGLTAEMLLSHLAQELEVSFTEGEDGLREKVQQRIAALERAGKVVVLLVDDAEQLLPEASALIVGLAHADDQFAELRVLLAADLDQSALLEALQRAHPQHGLVHVVEIPRLVDTQVQALIEQRMRAVELDAADFFSAQDFGRITATADGMIGKVVTLARQHVAGIATPAAPRRPRRASARGQPMRITRTQVNLAFGILAAAALAAGAWWATRNPLVATTAETEAVPLPVPAEAPTDAPPAPVAGTVPETPDEPLAVEDEVDVPVASSTDAMPVELPTEPEPAPPATTAPAEPLPPAEPVELGAVPDTAPSPRTEVVPGKMATAPSEPASAVAAVPVPEPAAPPVAAEPPAEAPTPVPPPTAVPARPAPAAVATPEATPPKPAPPKAAPPKPMPATRPVAKPVPPPAAPTVPLLSADWLLKQPATAHTLQLFGVRERAAAERYRVQRGISRESVILTGTLDGKPWYVVTYGVYPNRAAALSAMTRLPPALRDTKPWARSVGSLRGVLE